MTTPAPQGMALTDAQIARELAAQHGQWDFDSSTTPNGNEPEEEREWWTDVAKSARAILAKAATQESALLAYSRLSEEVAQEPAEPYAWAYECGETVHLRKVQLDSYFSIDGGKSYVKGTPLFTRLLPKAEPTGSASEAVAEICSCYELRFVGTESIAAIARKTGMKVGDKLYLHPPVIQERKPMTEAEIQDEFQAVANDDPEVHLRFARAIEAHHGITSEGAGHG